MDRKRLLELGILLAAAVLEVAGDAVIRSGMRGRGLFLVIVGFVVLGSYGVIVNLLELDFGRLLGAYVGFFTVTAILCGRLFFGERVALTTWIGLSMVLAGSLVIQFGTSRP
jgi:small multidrug resistance family-3 protein